MASLRRVGEVGYLGNESADMASAVLAAKGSIDEFLGACGNPAENQTAFHVKVAFEDQGEFENIWLRDLDLSSQPPTGIVANATRLRNVAYRERVPFERPRVTDWMYVEDGRMVGGFTTKGLMQRLARTRREDAAPAVRESQYGRSGIGKRLVAPVAFAALGMTSLSQEA